MRSWIYLLAASATEVVMAYALKQSDSWSRPLPSAIGVGAALLSIYLLTVALRGLPLGTAYVVWTGLGAVGVALVGILVLGEQVTALRVLMLAMVVAGTAGLRAL
jgi:quaternary ammonium compound-resistance protein SugE